MRLEAAIVAYTAALQVRTRDRMPLDWATSMGNQGLALMVLAERRGNSTEAWMAVQQIELALMAMQNGGNARAAAYYRARQPKAQAILDRLTGR